MKRLILSMLAVCGIIAIPAAGLTTVTSAVERGTVSMQDDVQTVEGQIKRVNAERRSFVLASGEDGDEITLRVNRETKYTLDGEDSTMEDALKEGHNASVQHRNNLAIHVDATTESH